MSIAFIFAACQPTPGVPPVIGRQDDILKDMTPVPSEEFKRIETPEHVSDTYDFGKLSVTFDADVVVPETTAYPVIEVSKKVFSDEEFLSLIKRFAGTNDELYSDWVLTKSEWMERIIKVTPYVSSGIFPKDILDFLQGECDKADEEVDNPLTELSELPASKYSHLYVKTKNNRVALFSIMRNENYFSYRKDMLSGTAPASQYKDSDFDKSSDSIEHFKWLQPEEPEISQEDAYEQASEYVNELDMGLELYSAEPCTVIADEVDKCVGWRFIYTRKISDLQVPYQYDGTYLNPDALPSYGAPWAAPEICIITIDKSGLCELSWQGASEISSIALNSVELEPFDVIQSRLADQLKYIYGNPIRDVGIDIKITKIELGISLISVKDKPGVGIYIPTWYAEYHMKWRDMDKYDDQLDKIILNAIDGSYIEPRVTNEKILSMSS